MYKFISLQKKNQNLFKTDPEKYAPQYKGYCVNAVSDSGQRTSIDPKTFKIDGKLYLFYHIFFLKTMKNWNNDETYLLR